MKTNFDQRSRSAQPSFSITGSAAGATGASNMMAPPAASCVRILLGIDVPAEALRHIKADWAMVAATQQDAPDLTAAAVGTALSRLRQHVISVAGVAVLEREDPFAAWLRPTAVGNAA
jgi:hypothetical protein